MTEIVEETTSAVLDAQDQETTEVRSGQVLVNTVDKNTLDFETLNPLLMGKGDMIDITPDPSLLPKMGQVGYSIEQAVAELVDNSVDACFGLDRIGEIIIKYGGIDADNGGQSIEVYDDGVGMTELQARDAVVLGKSNKSGQLIGQFGMGMKTACTFLGGRFVIETTTAEDDQATIIVYDEDEFRRIGKWELKSYRMPKSFQHGTRVRIEKLRVNLKGHGQGARPGNKPLDRTKKLLARQHRIALQAGKVYISVNTDPLQFSYPEWDERWLPVLKKIDEPLITGKRVYGVIGIAKDLKAKGTDFGFDLIRHGRIVKEFENIGFTRHAMKRNVYGMLHLDSFDVTNNKVDFIRDNDDWIHLEAKIEEYFKPIQRAIDKWYDLKGGPSSQAKDLQDKFVLLRETTADGKDEIKWVLPGHVLVETPTDHGTDYKWVEDKPVEAEVEDDLDLPDLENVCDLGVGENDPIVVKAETEEGDNADDGSGMIRQGMAPAPPAPIQPRPNGMNGSGTDGVGAQGTLYPTPSPLAGIIDNSMETEGSGFTLRFASLDDPDFSGSLGSVQYRHRAAHDGATNLYQSSEASELDGETVIEVVTNLDHPAFSKTDKMGWYKRNVAEAIAEHLVQAGDLKCDQQLGARSAFLSLLAG
jgi:hypothetical protein